MAKGLIQPAFAFDFPFPLSLAPYPFLSKNLNLNFLISKNLHAVVACKPLSPGNLRRPGDNTHAR